jgi:excisionase family DNA binding protein
MPLVNLRLQGNGALARPPEPATTGPTPGLLTSKEAAQLLGVSARTVWGFTARGEIPVVRIGRAVRYDPKDIVDFIERNKGG